MHMTSFKKYQILMCLSWVAFSRKLVSLDEILGCCFQETVQLHREQILKNVHSLSRKISSSISGDKVKLFSTIIVMGKSSSSFTPNFKGGLLLTIFLSVIFYILSSLVL